MLGYPFTNTQEKQFVEEICKNIPTIGLEKNIVDKVIRIRQNHKIKLPDAIILATALVNHFTLVTANGSDFLNIDNRLEIFNPVQKQ